MKLTTYGIAPADMLLFCDVVQQSSFTAAARANGISKQAVSERIGKLEVALGVRLLQRTTRSLKPTQAGIRYYEDCVRIAQLVTQANQDVQAEQGEPRGTLTVSAPILFGRDQLLAVLKTYVERYPQVRIDLRLADRLVNLVEEGVDVALRVSLMNDSLLSVRRLGSVDALFVASPVLLARCAGWSDGEVIRRAPAVTFREGETWDLPLGAKVKPNSILTINDLSALCSAAVQGLGVARLPKLLCRQHLLDASLQPLLAGVAANRFSVYAAYVSKKQLAPKIRSFVDLLVEMREDFIDEPDETFN